MSYVLRELLQVLRHKLCLYFSSVDWFDSRECSVQALRHIHSKNRIHRDVKSDNVLVRYDIRYQSANDDFGFGCCVSILVGRGGRGQAGRLWICDKVLGVRRSSNCRSSFDDSF
jgi:serine/threonine protein kinase